jgi:prepilin-type N-terminal cleavage/methylation domain-containing protein
LKVPSFKHPAIPIRKRHTGLLGRNEFGFTLIEIMFALVVSSILFVSIYNVYSSQNKTYTVQEQVSDMQQNGRVASDILSRHIRMAEFGQPTWTTINGASGITFRGIKVTDGGTGNPDTIEIVGCIDEPPVTLSSAANPGDTSIQLQSSTEAGRFNNADKCDIFIGERENAKITSISGINVNIDTDPFATGNQGLDNDYPIGTNVYMVKRVTYSISNTDLVRTESPTGTSSLSFPSGQIAINIEDFQVAYTKPMVTLTIKARTKTKDHDYQGADGDGYHKMELISDIIARNLE